MGIVVHMQHLQMTCLANLWLDITYIQEATLDRSGPSLPAPNLSIQIL